MMQVGYVGAMKSGRAHGYGVRTYASGDVYKGHWDNDNKQGFGRMTYTDGSYYEGEYFFDFRHGRGTYHYCNGDEYVGNWKRGRAHGHGIFRNKSHGVVYKDVWSNGRSTKTGSPMMIMLQSSWRSLASAEDQERLSRLQERESGPSSPCWKNPSKKPGMVNVPRPKTAPVGRTLKTKAEMEVTGLARTRFMENVIMRTLGSDDRNWH